MEYRLGEYFFDILGSDRIKVIFAAAKILLLQSRCLKITEKVSFNIASEASYVYVLSGQTLIKNAKNRHILASFWKPEAQMRHFK